MKNLIYKDMVNVSQKVAFSPFEGEHSHIIQTW